MSTGRFMEKEKMNLRTNYGTGMKRFRIAFWLAFGLSFWVAMIGALWQSPARIIAGIAGEISSMLIYMGVR